MKKIPPLTELERNLIRRYGITEDIYLELEANQGHRCAICRSPDKLVVDHDHETRIIRGLLCTRCNQGLGYFRDDVWTLRNAAEYVMRNEYPELKINPSPRGYRRGEQHGRAKLTQEDVDEIRLRLAAGEAGARLAIEFGVGAMTISRIKTGVTWKMPP